MGQLDLASRRAEEAALRRYQAVHWLDYLVGPLGIPSQPSEKEFISCLRSGLILCNVINIVQPSSVQKVIENTSPSPWLLWDSQPLPAYQYFENVRNFLVAVKELKLPIFEASVFEREILEEGSSIKVAECILALKDYHEWKQLTGGNGVFKPPRSPLVVHSAGRIKVSNDCSRKLDMSGGNKKMPSEKDIKKIEDAVVKALAEHMVETKENLESNLVASYRSGRVGSVKFFGKILSSCLEEQFKTTYPEIKSGILDHLRETSCSPVQSTFEPPVDLSNLENRKCYRACLKKGNCNHWNLLEQQEKELSNIKLLLLSAREEVESLQTQLQSDFKQIGDQVHEMSSAALGYQKAVKENRTLYNMVQDLKGNIRVYCRIRPVFNPEMQNIIDYIGEDGSLVVQDPKNKKDGRKIFQFNRVFGPVATQDEVFAETQPLVRSVMDGYNACIFAYGQTGSGKTYTMSGSTKEVGISYLALNDLFELSEQRKNITKYEIQVQMVEVYDEHVRDLLAEDSCTKQVEIKSGVSENSLALPEVSLHPVKSMDDVINLIKQGDVNRTVGSTAINSVLSIHVKGEDSSGSTFDSCLNLVDLASSDESNKSLHCLEDVITALAQKNITHIPYRNSKLTSLLQNSLGGNAKTLMLAHVNPEGESFGETINTLKFAQRVSTVELGAPRTNKESSEVLELKAQIESLKKAFGNEKGGSRTPFKKPKTAERTPPRPRRLSIEYGNTTTTGAKTPSAKPKQLTEKTPPPRPRRLSIENGNATTTGAKTPSAKPKQLADKTPPRPTRSSIENGNTTTAGTKTPLAKPKQLTERTPPPRSRRLSIENGGGAAATTTGAKTPPTNTRSRRLSLEGSRNKSPEVRNSQPVKPEMIISQNHSQKSIGEIKSPRSPIKSAVKSPLMRIDTATMKVSQAPRSPNNPAVKSPLMRIDTAAKKVNPKTPEPLIKSRNDVQRVVMSERNIPASEIRTPPCTTQGKGSHIRKSLRTIGKLINGSEKRNQHKQAEATPLRQNPIEAKSPTSSNVRTTTRRQSLTGIPPPQMSRRSSLGGISNDSYGNENRNSKTPPQVHASVKLTKRWL